MSKSTISFSRIGAAACAVAITAISAWVFVSSSDSAGRDPFRFAEVMAANAGIRDAQVAQATHSLAAARNCWNKSLVADRPVSGSMPECRRG
jgi:hypothetical protein